MTAWHNSEYVTDSLKDLKDVAELKAAGLAENVVETPMAAVARTVGSQKRAPPCTLRPCSGLLNLSPGLLTLGSG